MEELIKQFPQHLMEAVETAKKSKIASQRKDFENILIIGLGGSGIGGSIVAQWAENQSPIPVHVHKSYGLPNFVDENTLVIACSYSGNTEETKDATLQAADKGATILAICSGGWLGQWASNNKIPQLNMPGGNPPRSMTAYALVYLVFYLHQWGYLTFNWEKTLEQAAHFLDIKSAQMEASAAKLAAKIDASIPQVLAADNTKSIATRWRQQINENAKMLAWEAAIPEMNHNELVGWEGGNSNFSCLVLRNKSDHPRIQKRMEIIGEIIKEKTDKFFEIWSEGDNEVERGVYLIHYGDLLSLHLSKLRNVDIIDIRSIDLLKSELAKF